MFFVIETQINNGVGSTLVTTHEERNQAESKFHQILQYAAISDIEKHGAVVMTEDCVLLFHCCYEHPKVENEEE